ncbi:MAG TPA: class I SAM-dependent methyltransferase [Actinomycetota bacterium]
MSGPGSYDFLAFNAPLSSGRADALARSLVRKDPATVLDLGCGWGELLLRVVEASAGARGVGIDRDERLIDRTARTASERGLAARVEFLVGDVRGSDATAEVVVCVGADHAFGDQADALGALRGRVQTGGRVLFGTGFWERHPTDEQAAAVGMTPASIRGLADLVDLAIASGFRPLGIEAANRDEWMAFETGYLADAEEWLVDHPDDPRAAEIRAGSDEHRAEWLRGYGDVLGFAYLTLGPA